MRVTHLREPRGSLGVHDESRGICGLTGLVPAQTPLLYERKSGICYEPEIIRQTLPVNEIGGVILQPIGRTWVDEDDGCASLPQVFRLPNELAHLPRAEGALVADPAPQFDHDDRAA